MVNYWISERKFILSLTFIVNKISLRYLNVIRDMTWSEKDDICGLALWLDIRCVNVSVLISVRKFCIEIQSYTAVNFHEEICQDKKQEDGTCHQCGVSN